MCGVRGQVSSPSPWEGECAGPSSVPIICPLQMGTKSTPKHMEAMPPLEAQGPGPEGLALGWPWVEGAGWGHPGERTACKTCHPALRFQQRPQSVLPCPGSPLLGHRSCPSCCSSRWPPALWTPVAIALPLLPFHTATEPGHGLGTPCPQRRGSQESQGKNRTNAKIHEEERLRADKR